MVGKILKFFFEPGEADDRLEDDESDLSEKEDTSREDEEPKHYIPQPTSDPDESLETTIADLADEDDHMRPTRTSPYDEGM